MTSDRPYRDAMPSQIARLRMAQAVGSQFDTTVVAAFEAILAQATEDYRVGIGEEFVFETLAEREIATYPASGQDVPLRNLRVQAS
jgi:HD-GYP domain-containing protein (c-di-GMP phosphodiesterase class II)